MARRVEQLQVAALQCTIPGEAAALYNRAGDVLLSAQDVESALDLYGRAIDDFIEADRFDAAIALCRKVIRTVPAVVRTRCTLTWLSIGAGYTAQAADCVSQYSWVAEQTGRIIQAREHLRHMGMVATDESVRLAVGECLLLLGDDRGADTVFGSLFRERNGGPLAQPDPMTVLARIREAAMMRPGAQLTQH